MITAVTEHEWFDQYGYPTERSIKELCQFSDKREQAVSVYFGLHHSSDKSHHDVLVKANQWIEQIQGTAASRGGRATPTLRELVLIRNSILANPRAFHVALFCPSSSVHLETSLPASLDFQTVNVGYRFNLAPLVGAMDRCTPYLVVLIESNRARAFAVRGTQIEELVGKLSWTDLGVHVDDSRVGWSHHIDGNVGARAKAYWRRLCVEIAGVAAELEAGYLIIGCRDVLWGHMESEFRDLKDRPLRRFRLQRFEASPAEALDESRPVFEALRKERYEEFEREWTENPRRRISGMESTLFALEQGRVRKLLLGTPAEGDSVECGRCGRSQMRAVDRCAYCFSDALHLVPAAGLLVRKALLSQAEILITFEHGSGNDEVRALLRN